MSILFTADIQAEFGTLDKCQESWDEILHICKKYKLKTIVNLGDLKNSYNPVDLRIVAWWQKALIRATERGLSVVLLLGNHDRVGAYSNADNWLDTLKKTSGVYVYDKPGAFIADDIDLYLLPFNNASNTRIGARKCKEMAVKSNSKTKILCFHHNLIEARYNQQGSKSHAELSTSDLHSKFYTFCIGGDIHNPQQIGKNTYYVGSPFSTSWGEVNQRKRYLIVGSTGIQSVDSGSIGWYDPSISGFSENKPKSFRGTKVRISVPCNANTDYGRRLEKARRRAEKKYRGAEIYVVPKFEELSEVDNTNGIRSTDSDETKIREYARTVSWKGMQSEIVIYYMLKVLSQFDGGLRQGNKVKFISAKGINFLSFKKLDLDLTKKGITLVQGINIDRNSKSNGAGKTSLVQQIPVALFGKSFKDQKSDSWANRWKPKEAAFAEVTIQTQEKTIKVIRGRRPPLLRMYVDGKEVSSGMRTTDREGTQSQIERTTGFVWSTLANAVYIDRAVADSFLSGTKSQRTEVLSRFQNLERFTRALALVKQDETSANQRIASTREKLYECRSGIKHVERSIEDLKTTSNIQVKDLKTKYKQAKKELNKFRTKNCKRYQAMVLKAGYINQDYQAALKMQSEIDKKYSVLRFKNKEMERKLSVSEELFKKKECPTCFQKVTKDWLNLYQKGIKIIQKDFRSKLEDTEIQNKKSIKRVNHLSEADYNFQESLSKIKNKERELELAEKQLQRQYEELQARQDSAPVNKAKRRLKKLKQRKVELKARLERYGDKSKIYRYAAEAFSRDGIPAFLNRQLCPVLNKAASYYAELFSDSEVQVQFVVEKGEFIPRIINSSGGAEIGDQSEGEKALAGLIASFSLREAAPECNLLILDEPGSGLDDTTARQFAKSLRKLVKRFKAIYVVSHNSAIISELGNERVITVRKHHKISKLEAV